MINKLLKALPLTLICGLLFVSGLYAQQAGTGAVTGIVADSNGAVIKGATITLTNKATNEVKTTTSSDDGNYSFVSLQPGMYTIKVNSGSFAALTIQAEVQVGRSTDANATLGAAGVSEVVEVTAAGIQTTQSNSDAIQDSARIENLPINGRRFQDFATLTPTAQVDPSRGQISLSGQRGINGNVNVDGVDYNQPFFGGLRGGERSNSAFTIPQESIKEFQVVASGYSAEFGRSSGGIVNAVTKSGSNELHGSAFYLIRPKQLSRDNEFTKALKDEKLNALGITPTFAPTQHQWGGSIGGPIKKDKLFYFGSLEMQRIRLPRFVVLPGLPAAASITARQLDPYTFYNGLQSPYTQGNDAIAGLVKVDWNINENHRFNTRYNFSRNNAPNGVSVGETAFDPTTTNSIPTNGTEQDRNHIIVSQLVSTFSPTLINDLRFQWAKETRPRIPNVIVAGVNTAIGVYGTRNFLPTTQFDRRVQFADSLTKIWGNHTMKFGGEYSDIYAAQVFGFNQTGSYSFSGLSGGNGPVLDNLSPVRTGTYLGRFDSSTARYAQQIGNLQAAFGVKEISFFGQDAWRVNRKLTINFGLRYERQINPEAETNNTPVLNAIRAAVFPLYGHTVEPATIPDSQNEWGPRFGFAYDPKGDGKTVIRGFAGEYYARTPLLVFAGPINNFRNPAGDLSVTLGSTAFVVPAGSTFNQAAFDLANPQYVAIVGGPGVAPNTVYRQFAILGINLNTIGLGALPTLTPAQVSSIQSAMNAAITPAPSNFGVFQGADYVGITSNYRNPQSFQFGFGFQHEIAPDIIIGVDYSQVQTSNLERYRDINLPVPSSADPLTGRLIYNRNNRPLPQFGRISLRDSSARSLFQALTIRADITRKRYRINAFYTLSKNLSDDDNERDSTGNLYDNPSDFSSEYNYSKLDRRHQFVANPLVYLPYGIELSSAIRFRSGVPITATVGSDLNSDSNTNERPFSATGVEFLRNSFRNNALYDMDVRVQKSIHFSEARKMVFSVEFFNILNRTNMQFAGTGVTNYCRSTVDFTGQAAAPALSRCGLDGVTNSNFLQIQDTRGLVNGTANPNQGKINLSNNPGSPVFQMQLGARFYF